MSLDSPLSFPTISFTWLSATSLLLFFSVMINFEFILQNQAVVQPGPTKPITSKEIGNHDNNHQNGKKNVVFHDFCHKL